MKRYLLIFLFLLSGPLGAQPEKQRLVTRTFIVSLAPGLGTGGLKPGLYRSNFAFNLTSGYSYAIRGLEFSLISAANVSDTRGIQLSGIGNSTGINYELSPFTESAGEASLTGIQVAGIFNNVRDNVFGAQVAGMYNRGKNLQGVQLGLMNRASGFGFGNQTGVYNWVQHSFDGVQAGLLINETNGRLVGFQLAPVNIAGLIEGKNTDPEGKLTAVQFGLINISGDMHGFQAGLINIGRKVRGTQIGIINIATSGGVPVNKRNGTMIGLLNIGVFHSLGITAGELFHYNIFMETGTLKNGAVRGQSSNRYFTSRLEYSFSPVHGSDYLRQYGAGFHKYYYNRTTTPGMMEKRYVQGGFGLHYLQTSDEKFDAENFYTGLRAGAGYRIINKLSLYLTIEADLNYAWEKPSVSKLPAGSFSAGEGIMWPGWRIGLAVH